MDFKEIMRDSVARTREIYPRTYKDAVSNISRSAKKIVADSRNYARNILGERIYSKVSMMETIGFPAVIRWWEILIPKEEIKIFYASITLYNFASSLVQIFVPIYLFQKGFSLPLILVFFALSQLGRLLCLPLAARLSSSYGAKKIISVSFIFSIIYFLFLGNLDYNFANYLISAFIYGAMQAFLWVPYFIHLSKISPNEHRGKINGKISIYSAIATASSPLIGGAMIAAYGFNYVFALAIILIIPAIALLLSTPEVTKIREINFKLISLKKVYPDLIANGFSNLQDYLNMILWTIFLFAVVPQYKAIGLIQTVSLAISILAFHFIGIWADKFNRGKLLLWGSVLNSFVGILRVAANSFFGIFFFNAASIFTNTLKSIPWSTKFQEHMDKEPRTEYMAMFEIGGTVVSMIGLALFAFFTRAMPLKEVLVYGIIAASLAGLMVNLVRK